MTIPRIEIPLPPGMLSLDHAEGPVPSRRWYDDPPVETEVFLGDGLVEVHVGRGVWQTVAESAR